MVLARCLASMTPPTHSEINFKRLVKLLITVPNSKVNTTLNSTSGKHCLVTQTESKVITTKYQVCSVAARCDSRDPNSCTSTERLSNQLRCQDFRTIETRLMWQVVIIDITQPGFEKSYPKFIGPWYRIWLYTSEVHIHDLPLLFCREPRQSSSILEDRLEV